MPRSQPFSMKPTNRVIRFHRTGGPEVLQIDEIEPAALKDNEVLIRVEALAFVSSRYSLARGKLR